MKNHVILRLQSVIIIIINNQPTDKVQRPVAL